MAVSAPAVLSTQLLPLDPPLDGAFLAFLDSLFRVVFAWCCASMYMRMLCACSWCVCAWCVVHGACVRGALRNGCACAPRYAMPELPSRPVSGPLRAAGEGVTAVHSGHHRIRLHPGALRALQEIHAGEVSKLEEPL